MRGVVVIFSFLIPMESACFIHHRYAYYSPSCHVGHYCDRYRIATACHIFDVTSNYDNGTDGVPSLFVATKTKSMPPSSWEEMLRQEATEALLPVFFPKKSTTEDNIITAELSLKRLLRNKYRHANTTDENDTSKKLVDGGSSNTAILENANASRRRLAALVLGTSIMRLRHWYNVVFSVGLGESVLNNDDGTPQKHQQHQHGTQLPFHLIPYPLDSNLLAMLLRSNIIDGDGDSTGAALIDGSLEGASISSQQNVGTYSTEETALVRAMVDEHSRYLSSQSLTRNDHRDAESEEVDHLFSIRLQSTISDNPALSLSIQYSLPPFLTASLLSRYGYERTKEICIVTNRPGPITLRRNAIRFSGTDDELCRWLKEEDGIDVRRMRQGKDGSNNLLMAVTSGDGSNNYIVTNSATSSDMGTIIPPNGAIELMSDSLTTFNTATTTATTTSVEQHRQRKSIWSTNGWNNGYFEVQDAGSQVIVQSLEVVPGMTILDYCAGNGGKTFGLASSLMEHAGGGRDVKHSKIVAHDVVEERLRQIEGSMMRVGFAIDESGNERIKGGRRSYVVQNCHGDYCSGILEIETTTDLSLDRHALRFDAVLVDAPCSSTGVLRRRPSQRWDLKEGQVYEALPKLQLEILEKAASFVDEAGGRLVYSTCSILREENECVANLFELSDTYREGDFERWDFVLAGTSDESFENGEDDDDSGAFSKDRCSNTITLLPSEGSDGFFIARWRRRQKH
jgi:16S rRNA C967 or C1407 C5-methylase (RsmB/RsmF family)